MSFGSSTFATYLCDLKTKYYENTIALLPYEGDISELPEDLLSATEMLIVYFDPDDVNRYIYIYLFTIITVFILLRKLLNHN